MRLTHRSTATLAADRRSFVQTTTLALAAVLAPPLKQPALAISATTMSGKSKPELGMILPSAPSQTGSTISGDAILPGGKLAAISYDTKFALSEGGYYDIESAARDGAGDGAFVQIATPPKGDLASIKKDWFLQTICSTDGRYGSYGAPIDVKVLADDKSSGVCTVNSWFSPNV